MGEGVFGRACRRQRSGPRAGGGDAPLQGPLDPLTWRRTWAAYGVAHVGKSLLWAASDLLTLYILVGRFGIAPAVAGAVFLAGLTASALADLGVGAWLARRPGDAMPLAAGSLCIAGAAFPLTMLSAPFGIGAVLLATLAFRIAYAGCDVPHNALMGRLADTPQRAISLSRGRTIGTGIAALAAAASIGEASAIGIAAMLWATGAAATVLGLAMVPLLRRTPLVAGGTGRAAERRRLPWAFLGASVAGIVALGALGKALLHLPGQLPAGEGAGAGAGVSLLAMLIAGRTASACLPLRITSVPRGLSLLAATYAASIAIALLFVAPDAARTAIPVLLGLAMGMANLIGWALLALLARDAGDYGLYTMLSKLALGATGLALAAGLGRAPVFTPGGLALFAAAVAGACAVAASLCLTIRRRTDFHGS